MRKSRQQQDHISMMSAAEAAFMVNTFSKIIFNRATILHKLSSRRLWIDFRQLAKGLTNLTTKVHFLNLLK